MAWTTKAPTKPGLYWAYEAQPDQAGLRLMVYQADGSWRWISDSMGLTADLFEPKFFSHWQDVSLEPPAPPAPLRRSKK